MSLTFSFAIPREAPLILASILSGAALFVLYEKVRTRNTTIPAHRVRPVRKVVIVRSADALKKALDEGRKTKREVLVYWNIRGLAQMERLALEYAGANYTDVRIEAGPSDAADYKQAWFGAKPSLDMPFPNLPYMLDGDKQIPQSHAILKHIGRKYGLNGDAEGKAHVVDYVIEQNRDLDRLLTPMCYSSWKDAKKTIETSVSDMLQQFSAFLGTSSFVAGESVTVADFALFETLSKIKIIEAQETVRTAVLASFPNLVEYVKRVELLPPIKAYLTSTEVINRPINNPQAQFK